MESTLIVHKTTDTVADLLLLYGLMGLLDRLAPSDSRFNPSIKDGNSLYAIELGDVPLDVWIDKASNPSDLVPFIQTSSSKALKAPNGMPGDVIIQYDELRTRTSRYFEALKKLSDKDRKNASEILSEPEPHPQWSIFSFINTEKAIKSYNKFVMTWFAHQDDAFRDLLRIIFDLFSPPNLSDPLSSDPVAKTDRAADAWLDLVEHYGIEASLTETAPQITNPSIGKGGYSTKARGVTEKNLDGFWLLEYLRFAGFYQAGIPISIQHSKDKKIYLPVPKDMRWETAKSVFGEYKKGMYASTAVKIDILSVLRYMTAYLEEWRSAQARRFGPSQPDNHTRAISVVYLKDMGSSRAVMGMNDLPLPRWVRSVETTDDAQHYLDLIEEHRRIVQSLDDRKGDEHALLRCYREFLTTQDLRKLLDFARGYAHVVMSRMNNNEYAPQFTLDHLEEVIMASSNKKLSPILQSTGFRNIAEAIRRSTVIPQYQKAKNKSMTYEVRYGLGDKLVRVSTERHKFMTELSNFMHLYNRETARVAETRGTQFRKAITTEDIDDLTLLIDDYDGDTQLIAGMLVAYGYARDPHLGQKDDNQEENN